MTAGPRPNFWRNSPLTTAITIAPLLFWVCVLGKWLVGFNFIHWLADSITSGLGLSGVRFLGGREIDDPGVLTIATMVTVGLGIWIALQLWDHLVLSKRRRVIRASVKRISWSGEKATLLFDYEHGNEIFSNSATVVQKIGLFASQTGEVYLQIDPRDPKRFMVLRPDPSVRDRAT